MAKITFFTRTQTTDKNALVPVYIRVRLGRKVDQWCKSGLLINHLLWSNDTQQAKQKADVFKFLAGDSKNEDQGRKKFNDKVTELRAFIESEIMLADLESIVEQSQGKLPDNAKRKKDVSKWLQTIVEKFWHPEKYSTNLFSFIQNFIDQAETRPNPKSGRPVCYKMRREYEVSFGYLKEFAENNNRKIDYKDIDLNFYDDFTKFLQKKNLATNTIGKKIQTLKVFLNAAKEENKNPFDAYKSHRFAAISEEADTIALTEQELSSLQELDYSKNGHFEKVRDLFLVGCWTGCRFSDISQVTPESIEGGMIHIKQHKTGKRVIIPLHPVVTSILNKYNGTLPEPISNQKFNEALKLIAAEAKINSPVFKRITKGGKIEANTFEKNKLVTTHTARRSFATNLYKSGFPSISIMAITGHTTERSFLKYIKVSPDEHAIKLQKHWDNKHLKVV
jgi:integrase